MARFKFGRLTAVGGTIRPIDPTIHLGPACQLSAIMGLFQKYSHLTIDEVFQAYIDTDKEQFLSEAIALKNELEHRKAHGEKPSRRYELFAKGVDSPSKWRMEKDPEELPIVFGGCARDYFRIWVVNLCLSLLTLGIFSAWAKVRKKRYFYAHTKIAGTSLQYLGQPVPIFKGRLVAAAGFGTWYVASHFVTSLMPYVLGAGLAAAPWVLVGSVAFNARYSAFRNMTFHVEAGYWDAVKVLYAWGIVPALVLGLILSQFGHVIVLGVASVVFSFSFPWLICRIRKFIIENTAFGGIRGKFAANGGQFFGIYIAAGLIAGAIVLPVALLIGAVSLRAKDIFLASYLFAIPTYIGYILSFAYVRTKSTNLVWNNTTLGPLYFESKLRFRDMFVLYLTNAIGIIASCGFLIPWAVIRTMKYRVEHMRIFSGGELTQFMGSRQQTVAAIGVEAVDLFDWDLSL